MINNKRVVAIIQGRMNSSRLPGKVMQEIGGKPMLQYVVERVQLAKLVDEVVVATTIDASDNAIEKFFTDKNVFVYRGSMQDVLDRFYQAALAKKAEIVVRITADCPLVDPQMIDEIIQAREIHDADFCANRLPPPFKRTYPIGLDIEVAPFSALALAWQKGTEKHHREHVFPYLYETQGRFKVFILNYKKDIGTLRWTVDTPEDLEVVRQIIAHFEGRMNYSWLEVLDFYEKNIYLSRINSQIKHKTYLDVDQRK